MQLPDALDNTGTTHHQTYSDTCEITEEMLKDSSNEVLYTLSVSCTRVLGLLLILEKEAENLLRIFSCRPLVS